MTQAELIRAGLEKLDDALAFFDEVECAGGQAVAHFLHSTTTFAEQLLEAVDAQ